MRDVIRAWARGKDLFAPEETEEQLAFVRDFDLSYAERRLRFVIAGVSWLYRGAGPEMKEGYPSRQATRRRQGAAVRGGRKARVAEFGTRIRR